MIDETGVKSIINKPCYKRKHTRIRADSFLDLVLCTRNKSASKKVLRKLAKKFKFRFSCIRNSDINSIYYCDDCKAYHTTKKTGAKMFFLTASNKLKKR